MWYDGEIDMEELEARLYSQVYHSNEEELPACKPHIVQDNLTNKPPKRYFDGNEKPYVGQSVHRVYQGHPTENHTYFQAGPNVSSHQPALHCSDSANYYNPIGLFSYPAVNNIVLLPQPPAQIFSSCSESVEQEILRANRNRIKNRARRKRQKEKWKAKKMEKAFRKHNLSNNKTNNLEEEKKNVASNTSNNIIEVLKDEIICLSESDTSDIEIEEMRVPSIVVSSEDETDVKEVEIKNETSHNVVLEEFKSKEIETTNDLNLKITPHVVNDEENDDDVIFVEPSLEILTICDETHDGSSLIIENAATTVISDKILPNKMAPELVYTPESTNDFLDNSFNSTQNSIDGSNPKMNVNDFESDSNFSTSDFDRPSSRSGIFTVQEFDVVPPKNSFSELNLDSFTSYIGSKASTNIPSILTPPKRFAGGNTGRNNKSKNNASLRNSSDSSSESDYEDKARLINWNNKRTANKVANKSSSSESDECVINNDDDNNKIKKLPNLSPITSDEETNNIKVIKKSKKKLKRKVAEPALHTSGEKRKVVVVEAEPKRSKQSEEIINLNKSKDDDHQFFSSSDSEIEVTRIDGNKSPTNFDVELLNIGSSSTPIKQQIWNNSKAKRFSNYWTEDMKKFYRESWGHENFNVEEEQKTMSDDPSMWKIINKDQIHYKMLPRGPRCYRCKESGHRSNNCNKIIGPPKCILCGASGHSDARCPNKLCTSCGRRSHYSTTYCSRCTNSRQVLCKICLKRGHSSVYCTDLWRRYHLTKTNGPLNQPNNSELKPSRDRWCSGCGSRGHFEFDCNYYNRTHAPADPVIRSYENIYEERRPEPRVQDNFPTQSQNENGYYAHPNPSPWIIGCEPSNVYRTTNFVQNHNSNPNFYQQFPAFHSMPNIIGLNNIFYPNPPPLMALKLDSNCLPNTSTAKEDKNLVAEILPQHNNVGESSQPPSQKEKRRFFKLIDADKRELLNRDGLEFLKKLSKDTNFKVKIKIIKRKKKRKSTYWCMLEGAWEMLLNVKESIKNYLQTKTKQKPINPMEAFQGKDFNMQILQKNITNLDNAYTDWPRVTSRLYKKIKEIEKKLSNVNNSEKIAELENALKNRYVALNSVLLGKNIFAEGLKHMKILREGAMAGTNSNKINWEKLTQSYNYVFKNYNCLDEDYDFAISGLYNNESSKKDIENLFHFGISICKDKNLPPQDLQKFKYLYKNVVTHNYARIFVERFKFFYNKITETHNK